MSHISSGAGGAGKINKKALGLEMSDVFCFFCKGFQVYGIGAATVRSSASRRRRQRAPARRTSPSFLRSARASLAAGLCSILPCLVFLAFSVPCLALFFLFASFFSRFFCRRFVGGARGTVVSSFLSRWRKSWLP